MTSGCSSSLNDKENHKLNAVKITNHEMVYESPSWSPDGKKILYKVMTEYGDEFWSMRPDGTLKKKLLNENVIKTPVWYTETEIIYIGDDLDKPFNSNGELHLFELVAKQDTVVLKNLPRVTGISWNPKNVIQLAIGVNWEQASIFLFDIKTRKRTTIVEDGFNPKWSPDGQYIAYEGLDGIYLYNVLKQESNIIYRMKSGEIYEGITWSPNSKWIAFRGGPTKEANGIYILSASDSSEPEQILNFGVAQVAWSPSGDELLFSSIQTPYTNDLYIMKVPDKFLE
jgi:Tol biopolymer transport system component